MPSSYTDVDRLILDRWDEVSNLIEAREELQDRIADVIDAAGEKVRRWLQPIGYEIEVDAKRAQYRVHRTTWVYKRKGPAVYFALEDFCPIGYRRVESPYPTLWLITRHLENFRVKEEDRRKFASDLRNELGPIAAHWDDDECDDAETPVGRYLTEYDSRKRCELISSSEALYAFAVKELTRGFELSDAVDALLQKILPR